MKVLAGTRSNTTADTFHKFRHDGYLNGNALADSSPTSNFGWTIEGSVMIPTASIQPIPPELLVCCLCGGRYEFRKCKCKADGHIYAFSSVTKRRDLSVHVSTNDENMLVN